MERERRKVIERLIEALMCYLDAEDGDPDFEPDDERERDEDLEPMLGWNEADAPKGLWFTDGGLGCDGDDD